MIELKHVQKKFAEITPLQDVNAEIRQGDIISVIGPSGTGKSTLLRCINMLDPPTAGQIFVDGEDITRPDCDIKLVRRKLGMVFQSFHLFGHLTVIENLMQPQIDLLGRTRQDAYCKSMEILDRVGMAGRYLQYPDQLSGGQKQRVAIARTLVMDPEIILFDEPTSALDPTMVGEVQSVISDLAKSGNTMMIVTHEMKFAREICNRVFYMDQGGIYDDGTPEEIFDHPVKDRTRRFIRRLKILEIPIDEEAFDFPGMSNELANYCYKNGVSADRALRAKAVFEELSKNILIPHLKRCGRGIRIRFIFEYNPSDDSMTVEAMYHGQRFLAEEGGDALALALVRWAASEISHEDIDEDGCTNRLKLAVK